MNRRAVLNALRRATGNSGLMPKGGTRRMQRIADRDTVLADKGWDQEGRAFDKYEATRQLIGGRDHPRTGRETLRSEGAGRKVADALFGGAIDRAQVVRARGLKAQSAAQKLKDRPRSVNKKPRMGAPTFDWVNDPDGYYDTIVGAAIGSPIVGAALGIGAGAIHNEMKKRRQRSRRSGNADPISAVKK